MSKIDPISMQVINSYLVSTSLEMGVTLERTAYSTIVREERDYSCALFDRNGRLIGQADFIPIHLGSMEFALGEVMKEYKGDINDQDVFITNDPYTGAQHTPDIMMFSPIFYEQELIAYAGNVAHHLDVGGKVPGSVGGDSTEIFQEGLRLAPIKFFDRGKQDRNVTRIVQENVRIPSAVFGDLRAQVAANRTGARRFIELTRRYGGRSLEDYFEALLNHSEKRMRTEIGQIPRGKYEGEDYMDDDGISENPVRVKVTVEVNEDSLTVDFSGSASQVRGPVNSILTATKSTIYYAVRCILDPSIPQNSGCYRPIEVIAPEGTVVNPKFPAACGGRTQVCYRIVDAFMSALSPVIPEEVVAGSYGNVVVALGGVDPRTREPFVFFEVIAAGGGARFLKDGIDATDKHLANCMNTPIEALELEYPILVDRYELISDSGGPGRMRGGLGVRRDLRVLASEATLALRSDKHRTGPKGILGGEPGRPGAFILNPGKADERCLPSKTSLRLADGSVIRIEAPGGGGLGKPSEREKKLILEDIADGKITKPQATQTGSSTTPLDI